MFVVMVRLLRVLKESKQSPSTEAALIMSSNGHVRKVGF